MKILPVKIGTVLTDGNVFLAPLAGYTDFSFREICYSLGASLCFTEMVSCKGLMYKNENTSVLLHTGKNEKIKAAQIFGSDPAIMRAACESEELAPFDVIDINMGCPVPKLYKNGEGSALLENLPLAEKIISECKKSSKNVSVKFRTGVSEEKKVTRDFAVMCENAGADMITVHGRVRTAYYSGEVDYAQIAAAKNAVKIPVIANGGVFTEEDADLLYENTGADGIALARGALYNPFLFAEITKTKTDYDIYNLICRHIDGLKEVYPDKWIAHNMRKQLACYLKGVRGGKQAKAKLLTLETTEELKTVAKEVFRA
ncbi:MAG: tRNA-dihydrouridine synthase family protein [Christensenellaceae bacterium]|nr:tRNA-dihydrouridine synthase family protein [Christensenellaceae bacterium]MDD6927022.1 tRNA-dihydrouridine synthase family protein [bacterium]MDY2851598.1 tRNA-dihydrouridine synthase family protein [Christensenellaceae bacterium]